MSAAASVGTQPLHSKLTRIECPRQPLQIGIVTPKEIKFVLFIALAVSLVTGAPYLIGWGLPGGDVFTGVLEHSTDANNYLAYARQAEAGQWLFHNPMTGEPHGNVFFNLEWLAIGKLAWLLHISLPAAMNLLRVLCIGLMSYGVYWLSSYFLHSGMARQIALTAVMTGGGFGWIAAVHLLHIKLDSSYFIDLSNGNLFPFYWALKLPHFLISETFAILGLCFFQRAENRNAARYYCAAGVCFLLAGTCRPYDMLYLMITTALYVAWDCFQRRSFRGIHLRILPVLMCVPMLGYYYWIFKMHAVFKWWSLPGRSAPAPWLLALGFGMTSICLFISIRKLVRRIAEPQIAFLLCATLTAILLSYLHHFLHFAFQFATNIVVPAVILTLIAFERPVLQFWAGRRSRQILLIGALLVNSFTSIALAGQALLLAKHGDFRVNKELLDAYSWLNNHSQPDDLVLADFENSNQLPQYAHNRVFCGYDNAVRFAEKSEALDLFFASRTSDDFRKELLTGNAVHFVMVTSTEERSLTSLVRSRFLTEVFRNNSATIFYATPADK